MKIEIETDGPNSIIVRSGDKYQDHLGHDEALWCVASILVSGKPGYLRTKEEHEAFEKSLNALIDPEFDYEIIDDEKKAKKK